jgi:hypothetical protein
LCNRLEKALSWKAAEKVKGIPVEERIIQEFVHHVSIDEKLRKELETNPDGVIMREGFSPRVARVVARLVPHLTVGQSLEPSYRFWA